MLSLLFDKFGKGLFGCRKGFPVDQFLVETDRLYFSFDGKIEDLFEGIEIHAAPLIQKMVIDAIASVDTHEHTKKATNMPLIF